MQTSKYLPPTLPSALAVIAAGRDHILTEEFAKAANRSSQTIRKNYCMEGSCFGIRPLKFGNRLLWPVRQVAALLNGEISHHVANSNPRRVAAATGARR
jgi:hypothetical protein